jgi:hypothetical protein
VAHHRYCKYTVQSTHWQHCLFVISGPSQILQVHGTVHTLAALSLFVTIYALSHGGVWESGCTDPRFFDLGTSCFTPRPLYTRIMSPRYPLDRRLGGTRAGLEVVEERTFLTLPGIEPRLLGCSARSQSLHRPRYPGSSVLECPAHIMRSHTP